MKNFRSIMFVMLMVSTITQFGYPVEPGEAVSFEETVRESESLPDLYEKMSGTIYDIAGIYELDGRWDEAVGLLNRGIEIMSRGGSKKGKARLQGLLGGIIWKKGHHEKALTMLEQARDISESVVDKKTLAHVLYNIGEIYYVKKYLMLEQVNNKALEYHQRSLSLREEIRDKAGITHSLSRIGVIYERSGEEKKALEYHWKAIRLAEEIGYKRGITRPFTHLGVYHRQKGDLKKALEYYRKALDINKEIGNKEGTLFALGNVGMAIYSLDKDVDRALTYCHRALKIAEKTGFKLGIARTLSLLGTLYNQKGNKDKALEYFRKVVETVQDIGYKAIVKPTLERIKEFHK